MINDREVEIQKEEVFPSIIENIVPNQSFCSRSSSTSLNQFVNLLSRTFQDKKNKYSFKEATKGKTNYKTKMEYTSI